ncbi:MAG: hypothetical protein AABY32_01820 [Nanoarchaeota archaeon]
MAKKIILRKDMILAKGLSYDKARILFEKASKTSAAKYITFSITDKPYGKTWQLCGSCKKITKLFCEKPEDFIIEV